MHELLFSSNTFTTISATIFGGCAYYIADYNYYRVSNWVHYGSIIGGSYMAYKNFLPG